LSSVVALDDPMDPDRTVSYDVSLNDERCRAATRFAQSMTWFGILTLLVAGVALVGIGIDRLEPVFAGLGVVSCLAGALLFRQSRTKTQRQLLVVTVSATGLSLRYSDRSGRDFAWKDPSLRLRLVDYAASTGGGLKGFAAIPCGIIVDHGPVGISLDAVKGIRRAAKAAGVPVIDGRPEPICRSIYIGRWPEVPRPFIESDAYA
jgi:hypothetical protein